MRLEASLLHRGARAWTVRGLGGSGTLWKIVERVQPLPEASALHVGNSRVPLDLAGDLVDRPLFRGQYEETEMQVARGLIPWGGTVVDVGANQGLYSALAVAAGAGRVIAIEPHPALAAALRMLSPAIDVRECAASDTDGTVSLHVFPESLYVSTIRQDGVEGAKPIEVSMRTLDELVGDVPRIDLLKIDVENLEAAVLKGATGLFERQVVRRALVEVYVEHDRVADLLDRWGYASQLIGRTGRVLKRLSLGPDVRSGGGGNYLFSAPS